MNFKSLVTNVWYADNVFNEDDLTSFWKDIYLGHWEYKNLSGNDNDPNRFWYQNTPHYQSYFQPKIKEKIVRCYANGQSLTQYGSFHADDGDWTYLIYPDPNWTMEDGGGTEFKIGDDNSIVVYPIFNRVVKFRANISHRALPNIKQGSFRITIALKTNE